MPNMINSILLRDRPVILGIQAKKDLELILSSC